jgi:hypothetical protein
MHRAARLGTLICALVLITGCSVLHPVNLPTATPAASAAISTVTSSPAGSPFSYTPFEPLLAKVVTVGPLYVTGDSAVPDAALVAAGTILGTMLQHRPDIVQILRAQGAFTVVSSRNEEICGISYFSGEPASDCSLYGYGGAGGTAYLPITACGERNLLKEPDDPYQRGQGPYSQDICVHELAHTIMNVGLSANDLARIDQRFIDVQQLGLWSGDYAATNAMEFWAVMSQFYFWAGPSATYSAFHHIANGPQALKAYDPQTFALLDSIYRGSANLS